jgi:hypothetical protein
MWKVKAPFQKTWRSKLRGADGHADAVAPAINGKPWICSTEAIASSQLACIATPSASDDGVAKVPTGVVLIGSMFAD